MSTKIGTVLALCPNGCGAWLELDIIDTNAGIDVDVPPEANEHIAACDPDAVHVMPRNDLVAHDRSEDCVCGPATEFVQQNDGSNGWIVKHHALDGRP